MKIAGPWTRRTIDAYLQRTVIPIRLACNSARGWPSVVSLWYVYVDGLFWCATQRSARTVALIEENPRCGFEVSEESPPYRGIRGQGRARLEAAHGSEVLEKLIDRYLGDGNRPLAAWLRSRVDNEVAVAIEPLRLSSWDFSSRMTPDGPPAES